MDSKKWAGTDKELRAVLSQPLRAVIPVVMPVRDAIETVKSVLDVTIRVRKVSELGPSCGGPIDIAVITTDRRFRWVRHKPLSASLE